MIGKSSRTGNIGRSTRVTGNVGMSKARSGSKFIPGYTSDTYKAKYPTTTTTAAEATTTTEAVATTTTAAVVTTTTAAAVTTTTAGE